MPIADDFSVSATGDVRHVSGTTVYTVLELHAFLQDLADDASYTGNDVLDILSPNPSKLDGPRDSAVANRLNLLTDGSVVFNIDDTAAQFINFGSIKQDSANVQYSGLKTIGGIVAGSTIYLMQANAKYDGASPFWGANSGHIQILVKVKTGGSLIDNGNVTAFSREWGQTYSHFDVNLAAGGETSAALATAVDSNITLTEAQAAALSANVSITFGDTSQDLGNGNGSKLYKGTIALSNNISLSQLYQYLQYITRETSTDTLQGLAGYRYRSLIESQTGNITVTVGSTSVSGSGTNFTSALVGLELYDTVGNLIGTVASVASTTSLTLTYGSLVAVTSAGFKAKLDYTEVVSAPFGTFAGGTFFFARGWYVSGVLASEATNYQLIAHDGTTQVPPTTVNISVGNLVSGDRVLVARDDGTGAILKNEYTPVAASSGATALQVSEPIKTDTPSSGVIRIKGARYEYSSYNSGTSTFTLTTGLLENIVTSDSVFVPYIDVATTTTSETVSFVYNANFNARVDVRRGSGLTPIIPFTTTISVTTAGASVNASRNSDV